MGGAEGHLHFLVVLRTLVLVADHHRNRGAQGDPVEQAAEDFDPVVFLARGGDLALARFAPIQVVLDRVQVEVQSRRTALHDHANTAAVRFAEGADAEEIAEAASHGLSALKRAYKLGFGCSSVPS